MPDEIKPAEESVAFYRDAYLETYVRRNPEAEPAPGTSLYAVLEATGAVLAAVAEAIPGARDVVANFLERDRDVVVQPDPTPEAYTKLVVREFNEEGELTGTHENKAREAQDWPCARNAEGSF